MPRKQRFKPSRKPKPMPAIQAQEAAELDRSGVQLEDLARAPQVERQEAAAEARNQGREDASAH